MNLYTYCCFGVCLHSHNGRTHKRSLANTNAWLYTQSIFWVVYSANMWTGLSIT